MSALPDSAATGAKAKLGEREGKIENVTQLEVIKAEQAKIDEEEAETSRYDRNYSNFYIMLPHKIYGIEMTKPTHL